MLAKKKSDIVNGAFSRLLDVLQKARSSSQGVTVVLGAGCSLSSSSDPLTTESIVKGWVEKFLDENQAKSWPKDRVWTEFVRHWDNVGHADRSRYLVERLSTAMPGPGYGCLAHLIEARYIRRIVTTNFDLLLDRVLVGIPSSFRVGLSGLREHGYGNPIVEVLKVHGDISQPNESGTGQLRFSPCELDHLPSELAGLVREATTSPTIIIGYSGADRGFMQSLANTSENTAFWIVPDSFTLLSSYTGQEVSNWLAKRQATENIIDGPRFGFFDSFMEELAAALLEGKDLRVREHTVIPMRWLDTSVSRCLGANYHLKRVASIFLELLDWSLQGKLWNPATPPFAATPHDVASATALLFRNLPLGEIFDGIPKNEVDALLLLVATEVRARLRGYDILAKDALAAIRNGYQERYEAYYPHESFWKALNYLVAESTPPLPPDTLEMRLNCQRRLVLIVNSTPLAKLRSLLEVIDVLRVLHVSFASEAITTNFPIASLYRAFQEKLDNIQIRDGKLRLRINGLTEAAFRNLCECLLEALPEATLLQEEQVLDSQFMHVENIPGEDDPTINVVLPSHLFELLEQRSRQTCDVFLVKATPLRLPIAQPILRLHDKDLNCFLAGNKPAAILAGPSGSGKSVSVANIIRQERLQLRNIVVVVEGSSLGGSDLMTAFFPDLSGAEFSVASTEAQLAATAVIRKRNILLIVDGLNEASADFSVIEQYWKELLGLAGRAGQMLGCPIKLLITCREGTLAALAKKTPPTHSLFFASNAVNEDASPWTIVPRLSPDEIECIVRANLGTAATGIISEFRSNPDLLNLYSRPFWLAVAAKQMAAGSRIEALRNPRHVVGKMCDELVTSSLSDPVDLGTFYELLDAGFTETVNRPADRARNFGFAAKRIFGFERRDRCDRLLRCLVDVGVILASSPKVLAEFRFSHDLIEEHFLGKFLLRRFLEGNDDDFLRLCVPGQYFGNGLQALLSVLDDSESDRDNRNTILLTVVEKIRASAGKNTELAEILAKSFEYRSDVEADLASLLGFSTTYSHNRSSTLTAFFVAGIYGVLEKGDVLIPNRLSTALSVELCKIDADTQQRAEVELVRSLCAYRQDRFADALKLTDSAADLLIGVNGIDYGLADRISQQRGTLLSKMGNKAAAIKALDEVYRRRKGQGCFREAFENGLELGAVYRDMSAFQDCLRLYEEIAGWSTYVSSFLRCRLLLQTGTVKKNLLQQFIEPARYGDHLLNEEQQQAANVLFQEAMNAIQDAEKWADDNDRLQLLLTCMSEKTECLLVMAYVEPRYISLCEEALANFSALLDRHPMIARRIEYHREAARLDEIKSDVEHSEGTRQQHRINVINELKTGRCLAMQHGLIYQVNDCDFQLARFCARALQTTGSPTFYHSGIDAISAVIAYFESDEFEGCHYLDNALQVRERLQQLALDFHIVYSPVTAKPEGGRKS